MTKKRILVYGDSIPWGLIPATKFERYPQNKRWPGVLQEKLGSNYHIIEECLCARTLDSDDPRPGFEGRNGLSFLPTVLDSHYPLDMIIVSLGLNELKSIYPWTGNDVAKKMKTMLEGIQGRNPNFHETDTEIVLLSQPFVKSTGFWGELWDGAEEKSKELFSKYEDLAREMNITFVDLSDVSPDEKDGVHLDAKEHKKIANKLFEYIVEQD